MESDKKLLFKRVIEYFAFAAIAVQAVFAAFWLFKNIGVLQSDYVAYTYIQAAESLKVERMELRKHQMFKQDFNNNMT